MTLGILARRGEHGVLGGYGLVLHAEAYDAVECRVAGGCNSSRWELGTCYNLCCAFAAGQRSIGREIGFLGEVFYLLH
jgi:hypothetical protein